MEDIDGVQGGVGNGIRAGEKVCGYCFGILGVLHVPGDRGFVDVGQGDLVSRVVEELSGKELADEACSAGDEDVHVE